MSSSFLTAVSERSSPPRRARVAVVGCGGWTQGWHLPNLSARHDAHIAALIDPNDQPGVGGCTPALCKPMSTLVEKYGAARYNSLEEALADKSLAPLDGVLVAVPHAHHAAIGQQALRAGLHLLMEKPLTADVDEAVQLAQLASSHPSQAFLLNNTANWQPGTVAAFKAVQRGAIGEVRHVNCVFAAPLGWLFEGEEHGSWARPSGRMRGNGFGWGQASHTFAWVFKVTGLTPSKVYAASSASAKTGADLYDSLTVTCTNGCTISASGVGTCPDQGFKVVGNWIFGTEGMLSYCGLAGSDNVQIDSSSAAHDTATRRQRPHLEIWRNDGTHEVGPPVEFEHLDQEGTGPGSLDAFVKACNGRPYFHGATVVEGLKAVCTIDAMYRSINSGLPEDVVGCEALS